MSIKTKLATNIIFLGVLLGFGAYVMTTAPRGVAREKVLQMKVESDSVSVLYAYDVNSTAKGHLSKNLTQLVLDKSGNAVVFTTTVHESEIISVHITVMLAWTGTVKWVGCGVFVNGLRKTPLKRQYTRAESKGAEAVCSHTETG